MPIYELNLLIKTLTRPEIVSTLKRSSEAIFQRNGIIRSIENLGHRPLPFKTSQHGIRHSDANYFLIKFQSPTQAVNDLCEEYARDIDIIRARCYKVEDSNVHDCTLSNEILPPAYRTEVQKMVALGKKPQNRYTRIFKFNSGLDYYPFQK